jgi:hypothetical protein
LTVSTTVERVGFAIASIVERRGDDIWLTDAMPEP